MCLAGFQPRGAAALADIAAMLGLPGKLGFSGEQVWPACQAGNIEGIRRYCETDGLNTYLVLLAFERMRGRLETSDHAAEVQRVRDLLAASDEPHHREFLQQWPVTATS